MKNKYTFEDLMILVLEDHDPEGRAVVAEMILEQLEHLTLKERGILGKIIKLLNCDCRKE